MATNTVADLPGRWTYLRKPEATLDGDDGGWHAMVAFETDYSNLVAFVTQIAGSAQTITTSFGSMSRILRMSHPNYSSLYARTIRSSATGESDAADTARSKMYSRAKVIVEFTQMPFGITGDTAFMTWEVDRGSVYTTQPGRKFKFPSGEPLDQDAGSFATLNTYILTLFNCPSQNDSTIDTLSSHVNSATFMGRAAGSVLFNGVRSSSSTALGGVTTWQKSFTFTYRSYNWNQAYQRSGVLATPVDPAGNGLYETGDLNLLLS